VQTHNRRSSGARRRQAEQPNRLAGLNFKPRHIPDRLLAAQSSRPRRRSQQFQINRAFNIPALDFGHFAAQRFNVCRNHLPPPATRAE
jgi:hypothetical protein